MQLSRNEIVLIDFFYILDEFSTITIDGEEPIVAARASDAGRLDESSLQSYNNTLQVTVRDRVKVFELRENGAILTGELMGTESLLDPQLFVDEGYQCATMSNSTLKNDRCLKKKLVLSQLGNWVIHSQRPDFVSRNPMPRATRYRKFLGIYTGFAAIDFHEAKSLIKSSKKKKTPDKLQLGVLNARFLTETIFSLLLDQPDNQHILQVIYSELEKEKVELMEDAYGQQ